MFEDLKELLSNKGTLLYGSWVKNNSSYDSDICDILEVNVSTGRYWDAQWKAYYIEFKKGNSIWLDIVRLSEVFLKIDEEASKETLTLFFIPDKKRERIEEIICVKTKSIIEKIAITEEIAKQLIKLNKEVPRSLNAQASLTKKDVRSLAEFIINI
jgi:hypothetical protein